MGSVKDTDESIDDLWAEYVSNHTESFIFHHPGWFRALEVENRQKVTRLICSDSKGNLQGVLPLILTNGLPCGIGGVAGSRRFASLPRTPFCGPVADSPEIAGKLFSYALDIMNMRRIGQFQCKSMNPGLHELCPQLQQVVWRKTCVKYFPDPSAELVFGDRRNHLRITTSVRKTAVSNVIIRELTDKKSLKQWYWLYVKTMQRHLVPARSFRFFSTLWDNLHDGGNFKLIIAEYRSGASATIIAGSLFLLFNGGSYYAFNGSNPDYYSMRPNDAIQWHFQTYAHKQGYRYLDLGEVSEGNEGLMAFKRKWGIEEKQIFHYYFPAIEHHPDTTETGLLRKLLPPIWQKLPAAMTAAVGRIVNGYL